MIIMIPPMLFRERTEDEWRSLTGEAIEAFFEVFRKAQFGE